MACETMNPRGMAALNNWVQNDLQQQDARRMHNSQYNRLQPMNNRPTPVYIVPNNQRSNPWGNQ